MTIIKDIRREFFDSLKGRILIMCALDVDAICACRILQFLLESYNLQYSVAPVGSIEDLCKSFEEYRNSVDSIVLINFGNLYNIPILLKPSQSLNFYVIDSHRPINVFNYYKNLRVKIYINKDERDLNIPPEAKIFMKKRGYVTDGGRSGDEPPPPRRRLVGQEDHYEDGEENCEDRPDNLELLTADARELTTEQLERRQELRDWLVEKQQLMYDYEEYHFYNRSVSLIMYDLANHISKNNNYLLWLGIVGLTSQYKAEKITAITFEEESEKLVRHVARNQVSSNHARGNKWIIQWQKDLQMDLYRKWTFYDSLWHTRLSVCQFQLWNDKGIRNLLEFLVECGLKLDQCKQPYVAMHREYRQTLLDEVSKVCLGESQYKYNMQELITRAFVMSCGLQTKEGTKAHKRTFCANDFVLAIRALLESHDPNSTVTEKFVRAVQSLSYDEFNLLEKGFEAAQSQLKATFTQVKALITTQKVIDDGAFLHVDLQDQADISQNFARGDSLMTFARFLLHAYVCSKSTRLARRAVRLPLVLFCPDFYNADQILITGIPPVAQDAKRNFFAKAFEEAAKNIEVDIKADLSETNLVRTNVNHKNQLLDQLRVLLG